MTGMFTPGMTYGLFTLGIISGISKRIRNEFRFICGLDSLLMSGVNVPLVSHVCQDWYHK